MHFQNRERGGGVRENEEGVREGERGIKGDKKEQKESDTFSTLLDTNATRVAFERYAFRLC